MKCPLCKDQICSCPSYPELQGYIKDLMFFDDTSKDFEETWEIYTRRPIEMNWDQELKQLMDEGE